ncbi:hypothetical protein AAEU32_00505 [Pseudoalteromonas sp. SSDWG2]|uniref:hypothetical protein n=1 Tax=Pseudoalteromonas sp. SSDWG2 TaxID=3139391 RepID=UPI003BAC9CF1
MTEQRNEKLTQAHQASKAQSRLTGSEKRDLLASMADTVKHKSAMSWWHKGQWLVACTALITLMSLTLFEYQYDSVPLYDTVAYERIEIFDEVSGEQRVRVSEQVPHHLSSIHVAERQLAEQLKVQKRAYNTVYDEEPVRIARLVQHQGDWLLADCRRQVLIALSSELAHKVVDDGLLNIENGAMLALRFDSTGKLVAIDNAINAEQC